MATNGGRRTPERRSAKSVCRGSCDPLRPFLINIPTDQSCRATLLAAHRPRQWPRKAPEQALAAITASAHKSACNQTRAKSCTVHACEPHPATSPPSPPAHRMRSAPAAHARREATSRGQPICSATRAPDPPRPMQSAHVQCALLSRPFAPRDPSSPSPRWAGSLPSRRRARGWTLLGRASGQIRAGSEALTHPARAHGPKSALPAALAALSPAERAPNAMSVLILDFAQGRTTRWLCIYVSAAVISFG